MNVTVLRLWAASGFLRAVIEPTQLGVMAQFADQMQVQLPYSMDKLDFTIVTLREYIPNAGG